MYKRQVQPVGAAIAEQMLTDGEHKRHRLVLCRTGERAVLQLSLIHI